MKSNVLRHRRSGLGQRPAPRNLLPAVCRLFTADGNRPSFSESSNKQARKFNTVAYSEAYCRTYRSPVKEWQVSCFVLGTITLNGPDTVVCKYCRTVHAKRLDISIKSFYCSVCAIQSCCPKHKPADLSLFYWRPVLRNKVQIDWCQMC